MPKSVKCIHPATKTYSLYCAYSFTLNVCCTLKVGPLQTPRKEHNGDSRQSLYRLGDYGLIFSVGCRVLRLEPETLTRSALNPKIQILNPGQHICIESGPHAGHQIRTQVDPGHAVGCCPTSILRPLSLKQETPWPSTIIAECRISMLAGTSMIWGFIPHNST